MPVSKYKQVTNPINGINDQFLIKAPTASNKEITQKQRAEIF